MNKLTKTAILLASLSILTSCNQVNAFKPRFNSYRNEITKAEYNKLSTELISEYYTRYFEYNSIFYLLKNTEIIVKQYYYNKRAVNGLISEDSHNQYEYCLLYDVFNKRLTHKLVEKTYLNNENTSSIKEEYYYYDLATGRIIDLIMNTSTIAKDRYAREISSLSAYDNYLREITDHSAASNYATQKCYKSGTMLTLDETSNVEARQSSALYQISFGEQINAKCYREYKSSDYSYISSLEITIKPLKGQVDEIDYSNYI